MSSTHTTELRPDREDTPTGFPYADLDAEIAYCHRAQSWSPGSTRTGWVFDLEAIRDAATRAEQDAAIAAAKAEAIRLATIVARRIAADAVYTLTEWIDDDRVPDDIDAIAPLIEWMRDTGVTVDMASNGARDGCEVTERVAVAYATCREWDREADATWVEVDLLTGEVTVR